MSARVGGTRAVRLRLAGSLLPAVLATSLPAQTAPSVVRDGEPLSVGNFLTELTADTKVGGKRAGLICAPAGALRWREMEPSGAKARPAAARALHDAGVAVDAPDADDWLDYHAPSTDYQLIGDVVGVEATLCAPAYGLARRIDHGGRLKGEGRMRVEWRVYRLADHRVVAHTETCAAFKFDRPGMVPSDAGQLGLIENARVVGRALAASGRSFVLPASLIVEGEKCPPRVEGHRTPSGAADTP